MAPSEYTPCNPSARERHGDVGGSVGWKLETLKILEQSLDYQQLSAFNKGD